MSMMDTSLIVIPPQSAMMVFTHDDGLEPYLAKVRAEIDGFSADASTEKGRAAIKSFVRKIASIKTYIDGEGKRLNDEAKQIPRKIDAARKHARDTLEEWQEEVRKPVTDWEAAEEARIAKHTEAIATVNAMAETHNVSSAELRERMTAVEALRLNDAECEEYLEEYALARNAAVRALKEAIAARDTYEAEQAELQELRRLKADREEQDRIETARKAAAEKAEHDAAVAAERAALAAQAERDAAARREEDLKAQAAAAEQRAAEAAANAAREAQEAVAAEQRRVAAAQAAEAAETAKREADKKHRGKINRTAADALITGGVPEDVAKLVIELIAKKMIPAVSITY